MKKFLNQVRKGFSLVELLIAVVVLGILGAMLLAAGTAAQTKARVAVASNDIDSVRNAVYTAFTMKTGFMQMHESKTTFQTLVEAINAELDENWEWEPIGGGEYADHSGAIAQTKVQRDPWGNPYTMYVYTDDHTVKYASGRGETAADKREHLNPADSCIYLVIASAGPNGTGVGQGFDGQNGTGGPAAADNCVNNTDGIDDIGVVIRMLNGSTTMATFGWANAALGTLEYCNWYFCGKGAPSGDASAPAGTTVTGKWTKLETTGAVSDITASAPSYGSSLDQFPNLENLKAHHAAGTAKKDNPVQIDDNYDGTAAPSGGEGDTP